MIPFDHSKRLLLIGEVLVDQHLDHALVRLGGLFHLARALDATGIPYAAGYICPTYLDESCETYFKKLGATSLRKIGTVNGAPNVVLVGDSKEAGNQGYIKVLSGQAQVQMDASALSKLIAEYKPTDAIVVADTFMQALPPRWDDTIRRIHIDFDHVDPLPTGELRLDTAFCSTSGTPFLATDRTVTRIRDNLLSLNPTRAVLKENRGGSRGWTPNTEVDVCAPCYITSTAHSVGVGDCFNAIFVAQNEDLPLEYRLRLASFTAAAYARTYDHDEFKNDVLAIIANPKDVIAMKGVRLSWELRPAIKIYLAGPDFPDVDTTQLDSIDGALRYHNFQPSRPIKENGLAAPHMSHYERQALFARDMSMLDESALLIAIPIDGDEGTLVELGLFSGTNRPTILFDPHHQIGNLFARSVPTRVCHSTAEVIDSVFEILGTPI